MTTTWHYFNISYSEGIDRYSIDFLWVDGRVWTCIEKSTNKTYPSIAHPGNKMLVCICGESQNQSVVEMYEW